MQQRQLDIQLVHRGSLQRQSGFPQVQYSAPLRQQQRIWRLLHSQSCYCESHRSLYVQSRERRTSLSHTGHVCVSGESPPVSLIINPSRTQHFTADSLSLSCEDQSDSTGWTVRGYTHSEAVSDCSSVSGSTCNISFLSTSHTGVYWCQSESGGHSNPVNITVHNGDVILDSPVHPVTEGHPLTLHCLSRNSNISASGVDFYKDGSVLQKKTTGEMTISSVSKSDEGFYHCKHPERGESPKSWVSVRGRSHAEAPMSVLRLISSLVTVSVYLQLTIILAVKCYRARVQTEEDNTQNAASMGVSPDMLTTFEPVVNGRSCGGGCVPREQRGLVTEHALEGGEIGGRMTMPRTEYRVCPDDEFLAVLFRKESSQRYIIFSVPLPFLVLIPLIRVGQAQAEIIPVLSVEPNSPQIFRGETVTLTCRISGGNGPYHWYKDGVNVHSSAENYYTINVDHSHKYRCYGSINGRSTPLSNEVTLSVIERPKAVLTLQPDGQIFSGQEVTFTCEIRGHADNEWMYHWYKDGVQIFFYTENSKYSFTAVESLSTKYTCSGRRRSDSQTSETSNAVTLTVSEKPKPTVRVNPQSSVYTGDRVTLNCNLLSNGWTFLWYKDRVQVAEDTDTLHDTVSNAGETVYQCKARRGNYDSEFSDPVTVTVRVLPKPVVSINPDEQVYRGETVTLRCDIQDEEDSDWIYSWNKDGSVVSSEQEYRISSAETSHAGKYTCRGRERGGSHSSHTSDAVTLTVSEKPKPELTPSREGAVLKGTSGILFCTLKLQSAGWKFYWIKPTQSTETEAETDYYTKTYSAVSVSDEGQYRCRAGRGNPVYYTHYSDALWVNVSESPKAVVTIKPDKHVFRGETVTLRCEIQGGGDTEWTYSWYKKDYTLYPYRITQEFSFNSVINDKSGEYTCRGRRSDSQSSEISDAVTLTVSDVAEAVVSVSPLRWLTEGDSVTLSCEVKHSSTGWTFSWYTEVPSRDSQGSLRYSTALLSDSSRGSGGSYTLSPVTVNHTGVYMCRAERGAPVFHTRFSKLQPLCITGESPPVSLIINPSRTQHFTADSLSLSCEDQSDSTGWTVSGYTHSETVSDCSSVSGSTCNISFLSTSHTGVYWCQSESRGRSNPVNITVHDGDVILDSPVHPVTEGHPLTLHCLSRNSNISASGVDFYKDGSVLQKKTTGEMTISTVSKSDEGFYHCKHPERGESPKSWVSVRGRSHAEAPMSVLRLISSLVTVSVYLQLTIILAVKCYRARVQTEEDNTQNAVIEE
ncbi:Fc receptor-like protein 5 [Ictalurus punctatus]|uniref:Fc receptor-like protein 5 n=1 Tax=Ictalurus punctatus TaxID=7998 RepID=A0A9F7R756_ICTPU|nr:Fc receptor-like protein 5 [Ictalurus punctatus]